ncbi:MAG: hypothetical protein PHU75_07050 [Candidatus Nanopelagicales bacterium]|nr:hypothetical protein [Candidatus Nanopelagicales bacterium]
MQDSTDVQDLGRQAAAGLAAAGVLTLPFRTKKRGFLGVEVWSDPYAEGWLLEHGIAVRSTGEIFSVLLIRQPSGEDFMLAMEGPLSERFRVEEHRGARVEIDLAELVPREVRRLSEPPDGA